MSSENNDNELFNTNLIDAGNVFNVLGIMIGYENLVENRQQSKQNDIQKHNQLQAKVILDDLHLQFHRQNRLLYYQNKLLKEILDILKGEN